MLLWSSQTFKWTAIIQPKLLLLGMGNPDGFGGQISSQHEEVASVECPRMQVCNSPLLRKPPLGDNKIAASSWTKSFWGQTICNRSWVCLNCWLREYCDPKCNMIQNKETTMDNNSNNNTNPGPKRRRWRFSTKPSNKSKFSAPEPWHSLEMENEQVKVNGNSLHPVRRPSKSGPLGHLTNSQEGNGKSWNGAKTDGRKGDTNAQLIWNGWEAGIYLIWTKEWTESSTFCRIWYLC